MGQLTTESGQIVNLVITKTPRPITTGKPFVHPEGKGFFVKNLGTDAVTLKVVGIDDSVAIETTFYPGWNVEMLKSIAANVPNDANLQYSE